MLAIDLFKRPIFALSCAASLCAFMAQGLAVVVLPFYFINVMEFSQVMAGLLAQSVADRGRNHVAYLRQDWPIVFRSASSARSEWPGMTSGLILLGLVGPHPTVFQIVWRAALGGAGFGILRRAEQPRHGRERAQGTQRRSRRHQHDVASARAIDRRFDRRRDIRTYRAWRSLAARREPRANDRREIHGRCRESSAASRSRTSTRNSWTGRRRSSSHPGRCSSRLFNAN